MPARRLRTAERVLLFAYDVVGLLAAGVCAAAGTIGRATGTERLIRLGERAGHYDGPALAAGGGPVIWLHAASVGEVRAAEPLLAALRSRRRDARFILTCQTATGLALAAGLGAHETRYFPLDCRFVVRRFLSRFKPSLFLFVEAEIWPRLLLELSAAGVPSAMVGARVSESSFRRYRRVRGLFEPALATLACVCARDDAALSRLLELGAPVARSHVCGDVKLDALDEAAVERTPNALAGATTGVRVLFAVSTHDGEEAILLDAFSRVHREHSTARLVLAPRHPRRAEEVCAIAARHGRVARWSRDGRADGWDILVIDTTGEARTFFPAAECAFVGGTFVEVGGHNLAEPAAFGVPCAVGPHLDTVRHQAELLEAAGALIVVENAEGLARVWSTWLRDSTEAQRIGRAARAAVAAHRGAIGSTVAVLEPLLARLSAGGST
jgi:3-deoxy-D-manno-octulosonic-acid transferase